MRSTRGARELRQARMTEMWTGLEASGLYGDHNGLGLDLGRGLGLCLGDDHANVPLGHYHLVVRLALSSCLREKGPSRPNQFARDVHQRRRC